jgi:hypothetical protein
VQRRLDENPQATRQRRETVEHPFGTIKARMGATHFLMKTLPRVAGEMERFYTTKTHSGTAANRSLDRLVGAGEERWWMVGRSPPSCCIVRP